MVRRVCRPTFLKRQNTFLSLDRGAFDRHILCGFTLPSVVGLILSCRL